MEGQTPAEKFLIDEIISSINRDGTEKTIINMGAGMSPLIEDTVLSQTHSPILWDRLDVIDSKIDRPFIRQYFSTSVEVMTPVASGAYDIAFANYVLEHVKNISAAVAEIWRVVKPGGVFILSSPNPAAPEFILSKYTPLWFHQLIKGAGHDHAAHETHYAYRNIDELVAMFHKQGFTLTKRRFFPFTFGYLHRYPVLRQMSRAYDALVALTGSTRLMGNVGLVFTKPR